VQTSICGATQTLLKTLVPPKERTNLQQANSANIDTINKGGIVFSEQQFPQLSQTAENSKQQRTQQKPSAKKQPATKIQQTNHQHQLTTKTLQKVTAATNSPTKT
jgi:hypothetical protein